MENPDQQLFTKVIEPRADSQRKRSVDTTPALTRRAARRLPAVAWVMLTMMAVAWVLPNVVEGDFASEFRVFYEWGPPAILIMASVLLIVVDRTGRVPDASLVRLGLVYQVIVMYCLVFSQYWGAFEGVTADQLDGDRIGMAYAGVFLLFFAVVVPHRPRQALVALLLSTSAVPVTMGLAQWKGEVPKLGAGDFFWLWTFPYLILMVMAYVTARIIYQLGQDVRRAREMGSYRLEELLGEGGMGQVWRASHRMLARPAAVKLIRPDVLGADAEATEAMIVRFEREAQVTARLQSSHTVELYDFGRTDDGTFYYVMELLDGIDLERLVHRFGPLPPARCIHVLHQTCTSLSEAHRLDLVHRDIKPANIYLCNRAFEYDFVKVLDFGLVKRTMEGIQDPNVSKLGIVGTPAYMAPEVIFGEEPDQRADIYALGCVAYFCLTGKPVFDEPTIPATIAAHAHRQPEPPGAETALIPAELDRVVLDCLAKKPDDRIQSADALVERLDTIQLAEPWSPERAERWSQEHGLLASG